MPATIDAVMVKLGSVIMGSREGDAAVGTTHGSSVSDVYALAREHRERGLAAAYCPPRQSTTATGCATFATRSPPRAW